MNGWEAVFHGLSIALVLAGLISLGIGAVVSRLPPIGATHEPAELYRTGFYLMIFGAAGIVMTGAAFWLGGMVR